MMLLCLTVLASLAILLGSNPAAALPPGCEGEHGLTGRSDIVFCESWESEDWWRNGYVSDAFLERPTPAREGDVRRTRLDSEGCRSGKCLRVDMLRGKSPALTLHWPLKNANLAPEQLYLRYYLKLSPNWSVYICDPKTGKVVDGGGKFPGLADVRAPGDPSAPGGQCGNGGNPGDGINCWSHRSLYRTCGRHGKRDQGVCSTKPDAVARFGGYVYYYNQYGQTGTDAPWDSDYWGQFETGGGSCESNPRNFFCSLPKGKRGAQRSRAHWRERQQIGLGMNAGVLERNVWYAVELFIRMNTPGQADGIIRGWIDGEHVYEKTNVIFRIPGHQNLHVRTAWLDVYKGGTKGNCEDMHIWLDQMVLATDAPIGPLPAGKPAALGR